ncbi:3-isopropylmalate dehydratase small subunit, partial [Chloroflexota bacterium]
MKIKGIAHKYSDNVNTDVIIPARHTHSVDAEELGKHCMEDLDRTFIDKIKPSDIIVAGNNFGCGSSREQAPLAIKGSGISCIIAKGFARIFFRNSINIGLPILECYEAADEAKDGDLVEVDLATGEIRKLRVSQMLTRQELA